MKKIGAEKAFPVYGKGKDSKIVEYVSLKAMKIKNFIMISIFITVTLYLFRFIYQSAPVKKFIVYDKSVPTVIINDPETQMILRKEPIVIYSKIIYGNVRMVGASCNVAHLVYHYSWTAKKISLQKIKYYKMINGIKIWKVREENHLILPASK